MVDQTVSLETLVFVEYASENTQENDLLWVWKKQADNFIFYFFTDMSFVNAPIHDLLIRIKNAYMARRTTLEWVTYSQFKTKVLDLLQSYGFILSYEIVEQGSKKSLNIKLKQVKDEINDVPVIKFFSRPSRRWYVSYKDIKPVAAGRGIGILSTSQWLLPSHVAKQKKIGGELIAEIY